MADPVTTNLVMAQPIRASDVGTWDVPVNGNTGILDSAFGSVTLLAPTNTNITLLTSQAQNAIIRLTGALTANVAIILPSIYKFWTVDNQLTNSPSSFSAVLQSTSGAIQIGLPPGPQDVFYDGTTVNYRNLGRIGEYWDYAGSVVPSWISASTTPAYLNCTGTTFSSATYPILANLLGTTTLPDARSRVRMVLDQSASRTSSSVIGFSPVTVGAAGGDQNLQTHAHIFVGNTNNINQGSIIQYNGSFPSGIIINQTGSGIGFAGTPSEITPTFTPTGTINPAGSGQGANLQPTYVGGITMIRAA